MPPPVLDFHTHAQNVYGTCCVPPLWRPFLRNGLARFHETTGFDARVVRAESKVTLAWVVREMHSRFAALTFDGYLAAMPKNGVTHACALPVEPMSRTSELLALVRGHPEVLPFASVDFTSGEDVVRQLDRHLSAGCRGLKLHPIMQDVDLDDPRVAALFARIDGDVPILVHTGRMHYWADGRPERPDLADPERLVPLLRRFPKQPVVLGHMGLTRRAAAAIRVAAEHANAYLEVSFQPADVLKDALRQVGPGRLLLGSDWPASEARSERRQIQKVVGKDKAAERRILWENGAALLRLRV